MSDLIRDLEAVVLLADKVQQCSSKTNVDAFNKAAGKVLYMHHAEIAEAVRDAARLDFVERCVHALDWDGDGMKMVIVADDGSEHKADTYRQAIDAAIDAMHNSAGDEG